MIILTIRSDKPEAEVGLYDDHNQLGHKKWYAHKQLAETIHTTIRDLLANNKLTLHSVQGIVCFRGPGSFTGLRIGLTVGNAFSEGLAVPIVGSKGDEWQKVGIDKLLARQNDHIVVPEYGAPVHITEQKK